MGMALRKDISAKCREIGIKRPIDLVYLSSQTMGDAKLEAEILSMFSGQLPGYVDALCISNDPAEIRRSAHTLKGAARSLGAFDLARLASEVENAGYVDETSIRQEAETVLQFIKSLT